MPIKDIAEPEPSVPEGLVTIPIEEPTKAVEASEEVSANHDYFFLDHLQSVEAVGAWYYNQRFLGKGGNGTAFLVTCSSGSNTGMQFVLKVFHKISDPIRQQAFFDEVAHLKALNHPAITRIFDEGVFKSKTGAQYPFAVIEYVPLTVRQLLKEGHIDRLQAIRIAFNCLSALDRLHNAVPVLVHRDIKPENILISDSGAKLADFGLVKVLDPVGEKEGIDPLEGTQWPGMPWRYRTPELVQRAIDHKTPITTASDIYQFATVFYEILTGFNPQVQPEKVTDLIELDVRDVKGALGHDLKNLISIMLYEDPAKRPPASECLKRLNRIHREYCEVLQRVTGIHV